MTNVNVNLCENMDHNPEEQKRQIKERQKLAEEQLASVLSI